jgi:hypothetical protein
VKSFFFLVVFFSSVVFAELQFIDPLFNRLDFSEITSFKSSSIEDRKILKYFEGESLYFDGKPHSSQEVIETILTGCFNGQIDINRPRMAGLCLLTYVGFSDKPSSLKTHLKNKEIRSWLQTVNDSTLSFEEKAYLQGRILWKLPPGLGGSSGKSLLALESLRRLSPQLTACSFFMGQIYSSEGKKRLAEDAFKSAIQYSPPDTRATYFFKAQTDGNDRFQEGFYFGVVSNPAGGTGLLMGKRDNRLADSKRKIDLSIAAQSRGVYSGRVFFEDRQSVFGYTLSVLLFAATEIDQYFGRGASTSLTSLTEIDQTRSRGKVLFTKTVHPWYVSFGPAWFYRDVAAIKGPFSNVDFLREPQASVFPHVSFGWKPSRYLHLSLTGQAAKHQFISSHSFETFELNLEQTLFDFQSSKLSVYSTLRWCSQSCPFGLLSELSGNVNLPGVRAGRYRENNAWVASLDWNFPIWTELSGSLFVNGAVLNSEFSKLVNGPLLSGAGFAGLLGTGSFRSRLEIGRFNGENIIQIGLQASYL